MQRSIKLCFVLALGFIGSTHAGGIDLTPYKGKVVYLDFWASWCTPCRQSFPWLDDMVRQYGNRGLVVIGVNLDQDHKLAEQFLADTPARFPIMYDPQGDLASAYKVVGMPSAVIIDRAGQVRFQHSGFLKSKEEEYESRLRELLAAPAK